jgi:hypothetical protein
MILEAWLVPAGRGRSSRRVEEVPESSKPNSDENSHQDWLILSIIFWVIFVLLVSIGYLSDPHYTPPLGF